MKILKRFLGANSRWLISCAAGAVVLALLLTYKLGSLTGGLSSSEFAAASAPVGWQGMFAHPLNLPLDIVRSVVFFLAPDHGQLLTRLPNAFFGGLSIISFAWLIWLWHGVRTAAFATVLFATSAWTLHVSRLASFDVQYLWAIPTLLLLQALLHRSGNLAAVWYGALLTWAVMLYIPGMVWLVLIQIYSQRALLRKAWAQVVSWRRRVLSLGVVVLFLPLLVWDFTRAGHFAEWLGLPAQWPGVITLIKQFVFVPIHLFVAGPHNPALWMGRAPLLDVFTLLLCGLGIYFYAKHRRATRSKIIAWPFAIGVVLVGLGGPVSLSILVPLLYVAVAAGIAYLLHEWLKVFPRNPLARGLGIGLVTLAVSLSCLYNLRAYFVAWPHHVETPPTFQYHR